MANPQFLKEINQKKKKETYLKNTHNGDWINTKQYKKEPYKTFTFGKHITLLR